MAGQLSSGSRKAEEKFEGGRKLELRVLCLKPNQLLTCIQITK